MKVKNKLLTLLTLSAGTAVTTAAINKFIQISATSKNLLEESESLCYKWRLGNVHYTKIGNGKPLLLIHDLNAASSGYEWKQVASRLKEDYTVYIIDLLGCGRSEKINMTYTNYLYVQLISDFIKSEIGHRVNVIATREAASIPIMACSINSELFDQIMLINPLSILEYSQLPGKTARFYKFMVELPILGTLLYHIANSKRAISEELTEEAFYNPFSVKPTIIDSYYEASHLGRSPKSVYASVKCNYTKCNISHALKKINNSIYLIGGAGIDNIVELLDEYKQYNLAVEISIIPGTKYLPQLELPNKICELIKTYFN